MFVFFVLLAVLLLNDLDRPVLAGLAFAVALGMKLVPVAVAPALLAAAVRRGRGLRLGEQTEPERHREQQPSTLEPEIPLHGTHLPGAGPPLAWVAVPGLATPARSASRAPGSPARGQRPRPHVPR